MAFAHFRDQLADFLRRILQVGVERDDDVAAAVLETGHDRHVLAGIGGKQDDAGDIGPRLELLAQDRRRAVAAAVVDEDDLVGFAQGVERRVKAGEQRRESGFLVVDGDDDGECGRGHAISGRLAVSAEQTRSTSLSCIEGKRGSVSVAAPMRSASGKSPPLKPSAR